MRTWTRGNRFGLRPRIISQSPLADCPGQIQLTQIPDHPKAKDKVTYESLGRRSAECFSMEESLNASDPRVKKKVERFSINQPALRPANSLPTAIDRQTQVEPAPITSQDSRICSDQSTQSYSEPKLSIVRPHRIQSKVVIFSRFQQTSASPKNWFGTMVSTCCKYFRIINLQNPTC